jgi:hypothetical protein
LRRLAVVISTLSLGVTPPMMFTVDKLLFRPIILAVELDSRPVFEF